MFNNSYFWLMLPAFIISLYAQVKVSSAFNKYSKVFSKRGLTGLEAAHNVLSSNGVKGVSIEHIKGDLNDNFDPRDNTIRLSDRVYDSKSIAALGVAAHEAGHAVQHAENYTFLKIRSFLVPVAQFGSMAAMPIFFIGLLFPIEYSFLLNIGIMLFSFAVLFQIITLPVEFDASRRALVSLENEGMLDKEELKSANKVLKAAAFSYIAAMLVSLISLVRLILISNSRRR